jgi:1,4-alpha-glucan branching enzyme/maltooligosyltrehalose trehalohydrolase
MARLDWGKLDDPKHARCLDWYRTVLALRREILRRLFGNSPTGSSFTLLDSSAVRVRWLYERDIELCLVANLGGEKLNDVPRPDGEIIFAQRAQTNKRIRTMQLDSWAVVWCLSRSGPEAPR